MKIKLIAIYILLFLLACSSATENTSDIGNTSVSINKNDSNSNSEKKVVVTKTKQNDSSMKSQKEPVIQPPSKNKSDLNNDLNNIKTAQKLFPPEITQNLLMKKIPWPENFDFCLSKSVDMNSLSGMRSFSGRVLDEAALCLLYLEVDPEMLIKLNMPPMGQPPMGQPPMG